MLHMRCAGAAHSSWLPMLATPTCFSVNILISVSLDTSFNATCGCKAQATVQPFWGGGGNGPEHAMAAVAHPPCSYQVAVAQQMPAGAHDAPPGCLCQQQWPCGTGRGHPWSGIQYAPAAARHVMAAHTHQVVLSMLKVQEIQSCMEGSQSTQSQSHLSTAAFAAV
jgi:hypothetical protein